MPQPTPNCHADRATVGHCGGMGLLQLAVFRRSPLPCFAPQVSGLKWHDLFEQLRLELSQTGLERCCVVPCHVAAVLEDRGREEHKHVFCVVFGIFFFEFTNFGVLPG